MLIGVAGLATVATCDPAYRRSDPPHRYLVCRVEPARCAFVEHAVATHEDGDNTRRIAAINGIG